jgi:hypothetical protein
VYYGSDTRAFELLIGACLALAIAARATSSNAEVPRWRMVGRGVFGTIALGALGLAVVTVAATNPNLYPFGLLAVCAASVLAIRAATAHGVLARMLGAKPLVWLGERSYSLYLWHWPVYDVTRPGIDVHISTPLDFALRIGISLLLAHLTFRYIETPIRHGAIGRVFARSRSALRQRRLALPAGVAALSLTLAACGVGLGNQLAVTARQYPADPNAVAKDSGPAITLAGAGPAPKSAPSPRASASRTAQPAAAQTGPPSAAPAPVASAIPTAMPAPPSHPPTVAFVGDSQGMTLLLNKPANLGEYLNAIDDTTEGCGFLGGDISSKDGERRNLDDCGGSASRWAARVSSQHPDMVVVMIGGWDEFDDTVNGTTFTFGSTAWDAYYNSRLSAAVSDLRATGVPRIELALLPCYRPVPEPGSGYWPERGDDTRTRHVNTLLTAYAQSQGSQGAGTVRTLAPPPAFCTDPAIAKSLDYRWDGTHYYKPGSALYFESAIPQLLAGD